MGDSIIYLYLTAGGRLRLPLRVLIKEVGTMVTYSDLFTFVLMICAIITLVRNNEHKK